MNQINVPPSYPADGSQDFFCGGHTFLKDGSLLWVGGTDVKGKCTTSINPNCPFGFVGHRYAWRLLTDSINPTWVAASGPLGQGMGKDRWYGTATALHTGGGVVHGHTAGPGTPSSPDYADRWRDVFDFAAGTWATLTDLEHNLSFEPGCPASTDPVRLFDYPRLHLVSSGELFWPLAMLEDAPDTYSVLRSRFMDLLDLACSTRWRGGDLASAAPAALHINGSSVHIIGWRPGLGEGTFFEAVYIIGGAAKPIEAVQPDCVNLSGAGVNGVVERMRSPTTVSGVWTSVASLFYPRVNHNAVILLDGSILVVGGADWLSIWPGGQCGWRRKPELFKPQEVEDSDTITPVWVEMAEQAVVRQYHSAAGLMTDGRVYSVGGKNLPSGLPGYDLPDHSIEIFSPPYLFIPGPRPTIDTTTIKDPANDSYAYGDEVEFEVVAAVPIQRIALIRNGSSTHAFDPDQRYVELKKLLEVDLGGGKFQLRCRAPETDRQAPPGYYLLTVVDAQGRPSPAEWVRVGS